MSKCIVDYVLGENEEAYDIVGRLISGGLRYEAFFCADDAIASYTIKALEDAGYRVPEDVSVLGYDNREILPHGYRGKEITTIEQPLFQMGKDSIELLSDFLKNEEQTSFTKCYKTRIVEKETVRI